MTHDCAERVCSVSLRRLRRPDLRGSHRFGHTIEDEDVLAAAARRERFVRVAETTIDVFPVVHEPHVAGRADGEIGDRLETTADIAAFRG